MGRILCKPVRKWKVLFKKIIKEAVSVAVEVGRGLEHLCNEDVGAERGSPASQYFHGVWRMMLGSGDAQDRMRSD